MQSIVAEVGAVLAPAQTVSPTPTPAPSGGLGAGLAGGVLLVLVYLAVVLSLVLVGGGLALRALTRGRLFGQELGVWQRRCFGAAVVSFPLGFVLLFAGIGTVSAGLLGLGTVAWLGGLLWVTGERLAGGK